MATDTVKIMVTIEWHGTQRSDSIEIEWWDGDTAKEVLSIIMKSIGNIE